MISVKMADSSYGIQNSMATNVLLNEDGRVWAIECFNIYARRHQCINLYEAVEWNGQERIQEIVSHMLWLKGEVK